MSTKENTFKMQKGMASSSIEMQIELLQDALEKYCASVRFHDPVEEIARQSSYMQQLTMGIEHQYYQEANQARESDVEKKDAE